MIIFAKRRKGSDTYKTTLLKNELFGDEGYQYEYNKMGNIVKISKGTRVTGEVNSLTKLKEMVTYKYDSYGQLVRENNVDTDQTVVYTYVNGGNLKSKKIYDYTTEDLSTVTPEETILYEYDDTWKDQLTSYNGQEIKYDAIGNPTTYLGKTLTWTGRTLDSLTQNGSTITYTYNADGLRTKKKEGNKETQYYYSNGLLAYEKRSDCELYYTYDADGQLAVINYVKDELSYIYYPLVNSRGDIEGLYNYAGELKVRYTYDSWGKLTKTEDSTTTKIGAINPFRYRGYYYDSETGFYYVSSRYYDPEVGRFISPDSTDVLEVQSNLYDKNLYAYCDNNPVMRKDETGDVWIAAVAIGVGMGAVGQYVSDVIGNISSGATGLDILAITSSKKDYLASAIGGGIAAIPGLNLAGTAAVGALGNIVSDSIKGNIKSGKDIISSATWGAGANSIGYAASKGVAALKAKKINSMPRTQQKSYINRKLYRGSQANVNVNYHNYMSKTKSGKIGFIESKLRAFKSGIYSTITSTFAGLFRR